MGRLGLRCGEIARLTLDDIDWRAGAITVYGKGHRDDQLPLPVDIGRALVDYLRRGRPRSALDRAVFIRTLAPRHALGASAVSRVVAAAAERAGLPRSARTDCGIPLERSCCAPGRVCPKWGRSCDTAGC